MSPQPEQNLANHARFHPTYHFVLIPIFGVNVLVAIAALVRSPSAASAWNVIIAFALVTLALLTRVYPLKVQDRVIRLEEQVRLRQLLPADLQSRIPELSAGQLVAMRFCADSELEKLTRSVLDEKIVLRKEIKGRISNWRADDFRI